MTRAGTHTRSGMALRGTILEHLRNPTQSGWLLRVGLPECGPRGGSGSPNRSTCPPRCGLSGRHASSGGSGSVAEVGHLDGGVPYGGWPKMAALTMVGLRAWGRDGTQGGVLGPAYGTQGVGVGTVACRKVTHMGHMVVPSTRSRLVEVATLAVYSPALAPGMAASAKSLGASQSRSEPVTRRRWRQRWRRWRWWPHPTPGMAQNIFCVVFDPMATI